MPDVSSNEYRIPVTGGSVAAFWDALSTADRTQPEAFISEVTAHDAGSDTDGFVSLTCTANSASTAVRDFYTAIRVSRTAVPLMSTKHKTDWFQCFSVRLGADLTYPGSELLVRIVDSTNQSALVRLSVARKSSMLTVAGTDFDVTEHIEEIVSLSSPAGKFYLGNTDITVVARRTQRAVMGTRAEFDIKVLMTMNILKYTLCSVTLLLNTASTYYADFLNKLSQAESSSVRVQPASGPYSVVDGLVATVTPVSSSSVVHYTLDGTPPTTSSPIYSHPLDIVQYSRDASASAVNLQVVETESGVLIGSKSVFYTIVYPNPVADSRLYFNKPAGTYAWG